MNEPHDEPRRGRRKSGAARSGATGRRRTGPAEAASPGAAAVEADLAAALARARGHVRAALAEALQALRALADAASLATTGAPASAHPALVRLTRTVEELAASLAGEGRAPDGLVEAIALALDAEIGRWEARAHEDPDARAVLRAYLGLREMLWELGVRRAQDARAPRAGKRASPPATRAPAATAARSEGPRRRLQRVPLG